MQTKFTPLLFIGAIYSVDVRYFIITLCTSGVFMEQVKDKVLVLLSQMSPGRTDFEASYRMSPDISLSELHTHNFFELYFHIRGGRYLHTNNEVFRLEPGSFFIFPPFSLHGMIQEEHLLNYERAWIYITPDLMKALGLNVIDFVKVFDRNHLGEPQMYKLEPEFLSECVNLIREINSFSADDSGVSRLHAYSRIIELLLKVASAVSAYETAASPPEKTDSLARDVAQYVSDRCTTNLTLDGIAEHFSTSKSNICHRFSAVYHCSLYQYIQHKRISRARELIADGHSFTEAAYDAGFGDYSTFLRAFTKVTNMTPTEYQKKCLSNPGWANAQE